MKVISTGLCVCKNALGCQTKLKSDTYYLSGINTVKLRCWEALTSVCELPPQAVHTVAVPRDLWECLPEGAEGLESRWEPGRKSSLL